MALGKALARPLVVAVQWEHLDLTQSERIQREYRDRGPAEEAVERLREAGFSDDEVTLSTHGGRTLEDGTFVPGGVVVVVTADALRAREAERIIS
jgi:hypothetical protein